MKHIKMICISITLILALCSTAYAVVIDSTGQYTLDDILYQVQLEPGNLQYYDIASELFSKNKQPGYKVFCDGFAIDFSLYDNVEPANIGGRTMVPARALAESMGAIVDWDPDKRLVTIALNDKVIKLTLDSKTALVNESPVAMDVPAQVVNGRTMIPLRFVSQNFDKKVGWHPYQDAAVISIYDPSEMPATAE